jgi:hypothetical protein
VSRSVRTVGASCGRVGAPYLRTIVVEERQSSNLPGGELGALAVYWGVAVGRPGDDLVGRPGEPNGEGEGVDRHLVEVVGDGAVGRVSAPVEMEETLWQRWLLWWSLAREKAVDSMRSSEARRSRCPRRPWLRRRPQSWAKFWAVRPMPVVVNSSSVTKVCIFSVFSR